MVSTLTSPTTLLIAGIGNLEMLLREGRARDTFIVSLVRYCVPAVVSDMYNHISWHSIKLAPWTSTTHRAKSPGKNDIKE